MKKIACHFSQCGGRRRHWCDPDTPRGTQMIEVDDDQKIAWCSLTCAIYDGVYSLKTGWREDVIKTMVG